MESQLDPLPQLECRYKRACWAVQDGWEATGRPYTHPVAERQVVVLGRLAYNMRNDISVFSVELIVASVCRCNSTG